MSAVYGFWPTYYPLLLSFVSARLVLQTDLIMVSRFGESARAAFAVPMSVMFLDMLVAFAVAPVVSVRLAGSSHGEEAAGELSQALAFGLYGGAVLTGIGLVVYPPIVEGLIHDAATAQLAKGAVVWLTLAIVPRLVQFIASQALHGLGRGREVVWISLVSIAGNAALNWLLMFKLGFGFVGSYIATALWSVATMAWSVHLLRGAYSPLEAMRPPRAAWLRDFLDKASSEFLRVLSERLVAMATVYAFSLGANPVMKLGVLAVAQEMALLLGMPQIAFMRAAAIHLRRNAPKAKALGDSIQVIQAPLRAAIGASLGVAVIVWLFKDSIGTMFYRLEGPSMAWWGPYAAIQVAALPLAMLAMAQQAVWQSRQRFAEVTRASVGAAWLTLVPLQLIGSRLENPWIAWAGGVVAVTLTAAVLFVMRDRLENP